VRGAVAPPLLSSTLPRSDRGGLVFSRQRRSPILCEELKSICLYVYVEASCAHAATLRYCWY